MFDDIVKSIREYVSDRFMSPLGASLTVSWCLWNYKALLVVFSGESAIRKIHLMHLIYQDTGYSILHLIVGPLAAAAFYILAFPYPSNWVYSYSLRRRKEALNLKREIDDQTVLTQEESRSLRNRFTEMEIQHTTDSVRLSNTIDSLKGQLKLAIEERDALAEAALASAVKAEVVEPAPSEVSVSRATDRAGESIGLDKYQSQMLEALGRLGNKTPLSSLTVRMNLGDDAIWFIAKQLEKLGLVTRGSVSDYETGQQVAVVSLTDAGLHLFMESVK
ncbi:hypothetical protein [Stenotrophomonas sp. 2694]|jgi:hypothetical protein|uniref:hypothetical protein n=1 Tax=Stenotrophomonas sp. 2694 TaxID=3156317 RepID=UPI003398C115